MAIREVSLNVPTSGEPWVNWPQTYTGPPVKLLPASVSDLVAITQMRGPEGHRASGSRYSSSAAALPQSIWTDTARLNRVLSFDLGDMADEWTPTDSRKLVLVQAGIKLYELAEQLWAENLSLPTLGGELGQSLAGAISTSTHGSDIDLPPLPGMVRAIHLVSPTGQEYWLEHPDRRIASQQALAEHYEDWDGCIWVRKSAPAFNAALVAAGRCGFIYAYVVEVMPQLKLQHLRVKTTWIGVKDLLRAAAAAPDWIGHMRQQAPSGFRELRAFEAALNPDAFHGDAWITYRAEVHPSARTAIPQDPHALNYEQQKILVDQLLRWYELGGALAGGLSGFLLGGPLGGILGGISGGTAMATFDGPWSVISDLIFASQIGGGGSVGPNFQITSGTPHPYRSYEDKYEAFWRDSPKARYIEVFFDAQRTQYLDYVDQLDGFFSAQGTGKQAGYVALRFMGAIAAPLAMQRWPVTAAVEIALLEPFGGVDAALEIAQRLAMQYDMRFHLGMKRPRGIYSRPFGQEIAAWRKGASMLGVRSGDNFSTTFSQDLQLEPSARRRDNLLLMAA